MASTAALLAMTSSELLAAATSHSEGVKLHQRTPLPKNFIKCPALCFPLQQYDATALTCLLDGAKIRSRFWLARARCKNFFHVIIFLSKSQRSLVSLQAELIYIHVDKHLDVWESDIGCQIMTSFEVRFWSHVIDCL